MTFERASIVEARGLVFAYRDTPGSAGPALAGVDLTLRAGQTLALLGPNGAGKSSLMRLIAGRLRPDAGSVQVCGGNPHRDRSARSGIGWVPQEIALYPRLTVAENLDIFARLAGLSRTERTRSLPRLLDTTGIAHVAGRIVGTLSGGYQRRVNIAASLVAEPQLILLDEPTQGVDLEARDAIHALLLRLRAAGAAILLSTHDFAEAERLADRVAILRDGRLLREGPLRTLLNPFTDAPPEQEVRLPVLPDARTRTLLGRRGFSSIGDPLIWHASHGDADRPDGAALLDALRADGLEIAELRLRRPGLETLYRDTLAPPPALRPAIRSDHAEAVS